MTQAFGSGPRNSEIWGPNYWISIQDYRPASAEEIKPFFTKLAEEQFDSGVRNFYVEVAADKKDQIQSWFELGFGLQHVSAQLDNFSPLPAPRGLVIRKPSENDLDEMAILEQSLTIHQQQSPVFSQLKTESLEALKEDLREEINGDLLSLFVAEFEGQVVALSYGCTTEKSQLHSGIMRPENSATLAFCAVLPEFRGRGFGKAIASQVVEDLYNRGFTTIVTDWRATNQLSSVTWPKMGFVPTLYRLHRAIGSQI